MNGFDLSTISNCYVGSAPASAIYIGSQLIWPSTPPPHDYSQDYLTFTALENTTFTFTTNALQYSLDDGNTWTTLAANTASPTVTTGNKILWKQTGLTPTSVDGIGRFSSTGNFDASGNIMSLYYGDNFTGQTTLDSSGYNFKYLFYQCSKLISAENLILPATTLATRCYQYMFRDCSSLIITPSRLPATTLDDRCYYGMFQNCSSLTTAPELPATTLDQYCYYNMFNGCTSLITAPELPATTLANYCYANMFSGCASLTTAPETLPATTLAQYCYYDMFVSCTSLTTAPETLPATTLAQYCYYGMFYNCTSLTIAPELPEATSMAQSYGCMFQNCTSLNYIKCLATNVGSSTQRWVQNVAASGTFVKNANMSSWTTGNNGIPSGWTIQNA